MKYSYVLKKALFLFVIVLLFNNSYSITNSNTEQIYLGSDNVDLSNNNNNKLENESKSILVVSNVELKEDDILTKKESTVNNNNRNNSINDNNKVVESSTKDNKAIEKSEEKENSNKNISNEKNAVEKNEKNEKNQISKNSINKENTEEDCGCDEKNDKTTNNNNSNANTNKDKDNKEKNKDKDNRKSNNKENLNEISAAYDFIFYPDLLLNPSVKVSNYISINNKLEISTSKNYDSTDLIVEAYFANRLVEDGWNKLSIETFIVDNDSNEKNRNEEEIKENNTSKSKYSKRDVAKLVNNPYVQSYFAGYTEGRLTHSQIKNFYSNILNNSTNRSTRSESWNDMKNFFKKVGERLSKKVELGEKLVDGITKEYSDLLSLGVFQLMGLMSGYNFTERLGYDQSSKQNSAIKELQLEDFLIIQADGELSELSRMLSYRKAPKRFKLGSKGYFKNAFGIEFNDKNKEDFFSKNFHARMNLKTDHCSALIKVLKDEFGRPYDILSGHVTWSDYSEGIKFVKKYKFGFNTPDSVVKAFNESKRVSETKSSIKDKVATSDSKVESSVISNSNANTNVNSSKENHKEKENSEKENKNSPSPKANDSSINNANNNNELKAKRTTQENENNSNKSNSSSNNVTNTFSTSSTSIDSQTKKSDFCSDINNKYYLPKPAETIFSSYAGTLSSTDDFYITSEKLMITETTLEVADVNLYKSARNEQNYIPNFLRVKAASEYSKTAENWMHQICSYNTGTYSSQWIAVDYKVFDKMLEKNSRKTNLRKMDVESELLEKSKGLIVVMEQVPNSITIHDLSKTVLENSYFAGFNKALFQETQKDLNTNLFEEIYGDGFSYKRSPRAVLLNSLEFKVKDLTTFKNALMYNGYKMNSVENPFHIMEDPSYDNPAIGVSSRYDLSLGKNPFGATDFKMTSKEFISDMTAIFHHGPASSNSTPNTYLTPFKWSDLKDEANYSHEGLPDTLDFPFIKVSSSGMKYDSSSTYDFSSK